MSEAARNKTIKRILCQSSKLKQKTTSERDWRSDSGDKAINDRVWLLAMFTSKRISWFNIAFQLWQP